MGILFSLICLLALAASINAHPTSPRFVVPKDTAATGPIPRLIVYVQTFHVNGDSNTPLSLLPLQDAGTTHVIFAMTHLNDDPGDIHLNDNPYNASIFDQAWSDARQLQAAGIKVLATMGGAGDGSYSHLADNVRPASTISITFSEVDFAYYRDLLYSLTPIMTLFETSSSNIISMASTLILRSRLTCLRRCSSSTPSTMIWDLISS